MSLLLIPAVSPSEGKMAHVTVITYLQWDIDKYLVN